MVITQLTTILEPSLQWPARVLVLFAVAPGADVTVQNEGLRTLQLAARTSMVKVRQTLAPWPIAASSNDQCAATKCKATGGIQTASQQGKATRRWRRSTNGQRKPTTATRAKDTSISSHETVVLTTEEMIQSSLEFLCLHHIFPRCRTFPIRHCHLRCPAV